MAIAKHTSLSQVLYHRTQFKLQTK